MKLVVELELSEPLQERSSRAKVANAVADAILRQVQNAAIKPEEEDAYVESFSVRYGETKDLAAYRRIV
jgi:hypothetical protein